MIVDLDALGRDDKFRLAKRLDGWAEVDRGRIVDAGYGAGE